MLQDKLRAGEFDQEVIFLKPVVTVGNANSDYTNWALIDAYPVMMAKRQELKGTEVVVADRVVYIQKTVFSIRYRNDISTVNRLKFDGHIYEIVSVTRTGARNRFLELVCNMMLTETT